MADARPAPLVPPDTDLRSFPWMKLPINFTVSNEWLCASEAGRAAMVSLAVACWHQVPASSLPGNDTALASLSQSGAKWRRIKKEVLAAWTECSDGRFYHPVFSEFAAESMISRKKQIERTEAARLANLAKRASVTEPVTGSRGEEIREDKKEKDFVLKEKGERLPEDWQPSEADRAHAVGLGLDIDQTTAAFRDHWTSKPGKAGVSANWSASWRGWCRKAAKMLADAKPPPAAGSMPSWSL